MTLTRYLTMKQQALAMAADQEAELANERKPARRDGFLMTMESIVPWARIEQIFDAAHEIWLANGLRPRLAGTISA